MGPTKSGCCTPERSRVANASLDVQCTLPATKNASTNGMRLLRGGKFLMGSEVEPPVHEIEVGPFYIDTICVTNEQFNEFVNATGYKTEAERFGSSFVFFGHLTPAQQKKLVRLRVQESEWWCQVEGATWRHPEGPGSNIKKRWRHPVVHVSWNDASAYATWAGKRLPNEAEWEFAARGGLVQKPFPWGDELEPNGKHMMNVWQGVFPTLNTEADGYYGAAPAKSFKPNGYGMYNMTGNVWEWCWDWFNPDYYRFSPRINPRGPRTGERRVIRGGSYLCHASYCNRYRTDARYSNTPESSTTNCGFRCVSSTK
ncbi:MAG: formylglycine-generating enzyme family protein [Verrucomicrobiota bacterium]|nr:formylglycine-generating enzyme family protein [Verrucomicrobiota bacterium]